MKSKPIQPLLKEPLKGALTQPQRQRVVQVHLYGYGYAAYQVDAIFLPVRTTQINGSMVFLLAADAPVLSSLKEVEAFFSERMDVQKPKIWLPPAQRGV